MTPKIYRLVLSFLAVTALGTQTLAQDAPPEREVVTDFSFADAIASSTGMSEQQERIAAENQPLIYDFLQQSDITERDDFVDLVVRSQPYQIILTFEKDVKVNEVIALVPAICADL